ncbi:MAG: hypothetical protein IPM30_14850 [Burkholderiales bacterium]|nr:hypothetical protein [Burkholderiales bacterium]
MKHPVKQRSAAEVAWCTQDSDERWERRAEYLLDFFSQPSGPIYRPSGLGHGPQRSSGGNR